jgi:glycosyltransferase involved in cell wall biosynthesis
MSNITVSVVMVTFNHEQFIKDAVVSVIEQVGDFDLELIVADDLSPDRTPDIIHELIASHPKGHRIKYTRHDTNKGMISNFIWALHQCTGKYVALCDGDDYWSDLNKLQLQIDFLENHPNYVGSYHDTHVYYIDSKTPYHLFRNDLPPIFTTEDTICDWSPFHTSSFVCKRETIKIPDWFLKTISPDMAFFSIVAGSGLLGKVDGVLSVYRKSNIGISSDKQYIEKLLQGRIEQIKMIDNYFSYKYHAKALEVINRHHHRLTSQKPLPASTLITKIKKQIFAKLKIWKN